MVSSNILSIAIGYQSPEIFLDFTGGYNSIFSCKISPKFEKNVFWSNIVLSEQSKCNIQVSEKYKNIHFVQKLQMTMCFSSLIATTFVLTLFGLVPYLRRCISGQGVQGPAFKVC